MKYRVTTYAMFSDIVYVDAESEQEAVDKVHSEADYTYDWWDDANVDLVGDSE